MNLVIITIALLIIVAFAIISFFVITKLVNRQQINEDRESTPLRNNEKTNKTKLDNLHQINEELESTPLQNNKKTNEDEYKNDLICSKCKQKIEIGYYTFQCKHKLCAKCSKIDFSGHGNKEMKCHECGIEYLYSFYGNRIMHMRKFETKDFFRENSLESSAYPGECCICLEKEKVDTQRSKFCDHSFCRSCIEQFLKEYNVKCLMPKCPSCNSPMEDTKLLQKYGSSIVQWTDIN